MKFKEILKKQHYVPIPFPLSKQELKESAQSFLQFLTLPMEVKRSLHYPSDMLRATADGYTDKLAVEHKDPKEYFHYSPGIKEKASIIEASNAYPEVADFLEHAEKIYEVGESTATRIFREQFPEYLPHVCNNDGSLTRSVVRFLSYAPQENDTLCAKPHYDKAVSTLAIAESAPGLRIGSGADKELELVSHTDNTALFMSGMSLAAISEGDISPTWHDVVHNNDEQYVSNLCARWAIVFFVGSTTIPLATWEAVHTPTK